jgi:hypothetical protein
MERLEDRQMMSAVPMAYGSPELMPMDGNLAAVSQSSFSADGAIISGDSPVAPVPSFSSRPGAPATIYLDFDSHFQDVAAVTGGANLFSPAFAVDDNDFNWDFEAQAIRHVWARVAEDYAPFNVNVTTVDPGDFSHGSQNLRVVITGEDFRSGENAGGLGRINAFTRVGDPNVVYVFSISKGAEADPAGLRSLVTIANLVSHEAAHAFGLEHQRDAGDSLKAPIMNNANSADRGVWWKGTNEKGVAQDDMAVIGRTENGFGFRPDESNSTFATAKQLEVGGSGFVGHGVIGKTDDVDVFHFDTEGGRVDVSVEIARVDTIKIGNLDVVVEVFDDRGRLLGRDAPSGSVEAAISLPSLSAGRYFVRVGSQGGVGDVGQFKVVVEEFTPPRIVKSELVHFDSNLSGVFITFNKVIDSATFTAADVRSTYASVRSVTVDPSDPRRFLTTVAPQASLWTLSIGPDIRDLKGNKMDQNRDGIQAGAGDSLQLVFTTSTLPQLEPAPTTPSRRSILTPRTVDAAMDGFSR